MCTTRINSSCCTSDIRRATPVNIIMTKLKSSLRKFFSFHHDLVTSGHWYVLCVVITFIGYDLSPNVNRGSTTDVTWDDLYNFFYMFDWSIFCPLQRVVGGEHSINKLNQTTFASHYDLVWFVRLSIRIVYLLIKYIIR
jgi:hypothetical protein